MPPIALSLSEEVERFGAYAGLAAFFGLAVLTILYFAQAREVKRLREWAGRAPERAAELEARVAADAARRAALPPRQPPPRPAAPVPTTPAAGAAASAPAAAATAAPPATAVPGAGNGSGAPGDGPDGEKEKSEAGEPEAGKAAPAGDQPSGTTAGAPPEQTPEAPAVDAPTGGETPAAGPDSKPAPAANGTADGPVTSPVPRATPDPSRPPAPPAPPRPAPAAGLRQPAPASRRPAPPPPRRPSPPPPEAPPGRGRTRTAIAIGSGVLAVIFAVLIAIQLFGGDDERPAPNVPVPAEASPTPGAEEETGTAGTPSRADTTVAVLNGTTVTGLAAQIADQIEGAGFTRGPTANYSDQARSASLVFHGERFRRRAQEIARIIDVPTEDVEPLTDDVKSLGGDADVVVVVGNDQAP